MSRRKISSITIVLILLATVLMLIVPVKTQKSPTRMPNFEIIEDFQTPESKRRLLIIAPHPDDESLGVGGTLSQSLAEGDSAKVVFMTNGDGYVLGLRKLRGHSHLRQADYLSYGKIRQREALAAARKLGINKRDLLFIGFPDKGLSPIWQSHWDNNKPYISRYTGQSTVPYQSALMPGEPYTAPALLSILKEILSAYRPTDIYMPDTYDCHPDHWASGAFILTALGRIKTVDSGYEPKIFSYYIHGRDHPQTTPHNFLDLGHKWQKYQVPTAFLAIKKRAILTYKTQTLVRPTLAKVYAQSEETLRVVAIKKVLSHQSYTTGGVIEWPKASQIASLMPNPASKSTSEYKGLLKSAYIFRRGDAIFVRFDTNKWNRKESLIVKLYLLSPPAANDPVRRIILRIRPDSEQIDWVDRPTYYHPTLASVTYGKEMIEISLSKILSWNEKYLMFSVDTDSGHEILDRIPWSLLKLENS